MAIVLFDEGADAILGAYFNNTWPVSKDLSLKLFTNDMSLSDNCSLSSFTEASGGGYAAATLTNGSWTINTANDPSDAAYASQTYSFSGAITGNPGIYGYYTTNNDNKVIFGERLASVFTPTADGDKLKVKIPFKLSKGTPS